MSQIPWQTWQTWQEVVGSEASAADRPILLFLRASWCRHSDHLENVVFSDPRVAAAVCENYRPVRVDENEASEVQERLGLTGWPTLAVLRPGGELVVAASNLQPEEARRLVMRAAEYGGADGGKPDLEELIGSPGSGSSDAGFSKSTVHAVARSLLEAFDRSCGGFGTSQKFPHPEALDFAILYYSKTQDPAYREVVQKTLSAMAEGRLFDSVSGGFFRFCATRDWRQPDTEMRLDSQAGLLRNYLEASQLFDREDFRRVAEKTLSYIEHGLRDEASGTWFGSRDADDAYYSLDETKRADRKPPPAEAMCYTASVAMTVSSLLKAASVLGEGHLRVRAREGLHFLLEKCYVTGRGMYHSWDESRHILGMLADQVYTARALIHAAQHFGDNSYLDIAEDLIEVFSKKESPTHGGFYDLPEDDLRFAQQRRRNQTLMENGVAAELLLRSYYLTGRDDHLQAARRTLEAFGLDYHQYGYFSAAYGRAVELFFHHPIVVTVVGEAGDPLRDELLATSQATYVPSKVVVAIDPVQETALLDRRGLPRRARPTAFVGIERAYVGEATDSEALARMMIEGEGRRR